MLFVVLADGLTLDDDLRAGIARALRSQLSPRHVPDTIRAVPAIPRTLTGKKLEVPVKRLLRGEHDRRGRQQGLAARPDGARPARRDRGGGQTRSWRDARTERIALEDIVAIDMHAHVEMSQAGGDSLPDELREAAVKHFRGESARPTARRARGLLPRAAR